MAYLLKYYKELVSHGHRWRLEIHQDTDNAIEAVEIGPVLQGLRLIMQGDQADIDTPIVKTSLEMVFVDAPDLEDERKCGYWEEFYTSSATEYKVQLYKDDSLEWSGYITPDSFSESLQYRGSVTIIARDNLGMLQDYIYSGFPNAAGMQAIYSVVNTALQVISFPMEFSISEQGNRSFPRTLDSVLTSEVWSVLFNNSSLRDKTWQEALESLLYSTGLVLRYVGRNRFVLTSIKDIPLYDYEYNWDVPVLDVRFCAYGQRELSPAAKDVVDEISFEIKSNIADVDIPADAYGEEGTYSYRDAAYEVGNENAEVYSMPIFALSDNSWSAPSLEKSLYINPFKYSLKEGYSSTKYGDLRSQDVIYIAANDASVIEGKEAEGFKSAIWREKIGKGRYKFSFKLDTPIALYDSYTKIGFTDRSPNFSRLHYYLRYYSDDGVVNKEYSSALSSWVSGAINEINAEFGNATSFPVKLEFPELDVEGIGTIELEIKAIYVAPDLNITSWKSKGAYVQVKDLQLEDTLPYNTFLPQSLKVTTHYNDRNNIRIQRNANFGFNMGQISSPKTILNGLYVIKDSWYKASDRWVFNIEDAPQPLSVLIHQQLLAYYSKPNNVLTGELATDNPLFNALYKWNGKKHLLTSGALNVITGRMENVVLREFTRYDHMWETWVETDDVEVDYAAISIQLRVHSNKTITSADLSGLPLWLIGSVQSAGNGVYVVSLAVEANSSIERTTIINIDTALVRITQLAPGDYGLDYGEDYS